jgi:predicted transcriptional regulator
MKSFEDIVIFVADMEQAIDKLETSDRKLLAMNVLEEYTVREVAQLLGSTQRTIERSLQGALDELSRILLSTGLLEELPAMTAQEQVCQGANHCNSYICNSNKRANKVHKVGGTPSSNLVS